MTTLYIFLYIIVFFLIGWLFKYIYLVEKKVNVLRREVADIRMQMAQSTNILLALARLNLVNPETFKTKVSERKENIDLLSKIII